MSPLALEYSSIFTAAVYGTNDISIIRHSHNEHQSLERRFHFSSKIKYFVFFIIICTQFTDTYGFFSRVSKDLLDLSIDWKKVWLIEGNFSLKF